MTELGNHIHKNAGNQSGIYAKLTTIDNLEEISSCKTCHASYLLNTENHHRSTTVVKLRPRVTYICITFHNKNIFLHIISFVFQDTLWG